MSDFWWGVLFFTLYIPLLFMWGFTLFDIFSRHDLHGWQKALWVLAILFLPILGMLAYFIFRPHDAVDSWATSAGGAYASPGAYYSGYPGGVAPSTAASGAPYNAYSGVIEADEATELQMLIRLHDSGTLNDEEFAKLRQKFA